MTALACLTLLALLALAGLTAATAAPLWHRTTAALVAVTSLWSLVGLLRTSGWMRMRATVDSGPG
ncbi:MAG: hypothetical protein KBG48_10105 [Kofleriaceae bacterium]|jgi:exosortase/archaeosortase|nr:hypothetical protein [Kofleriaceae bacterium]MBP9167731.1 hypothetical protein [Kofleriaceae bacterium]MBP9857772.1 hypothetical protein [Kofleriaceae bacterium]